MDGRLRLNVTLPLSELDPDPEYIVKIEGEILAFVDENGAEEELAGSLEAYLIQVNRIFEDGRSVFTVADAHSHYILEALSQILDPKTEEVRDDVQKVFNYTIDLGDILFLDTITILPQHRGEGVGLAAMQRLLDLCCAGCSCAVLKPFPMQHHAEFRRKEKPEPAMRYDLFVKGREAGRKRIARYWERLGFRKLPNSYYHALSFGLERPEMRE